MYVQNTLFKRYARLFFLRLIGQDEQSFLRKGKEN